MTVILTWGRVRRKESAFLILDSVESSLFTRALLFNRCAPNATKPTGFAELVLLTRSFSLDIL